MDENYWLRVVEVPKLTAYLRGLRGSWCIIRDYTDDPIEIKRFLVKISTKGELTHLKSNVAYC